MTLGGLIRQRRSELGKTQQEIAKEVGVSKQSIVALEKRNAFSVRHLEKLLKVLKGKIVWHD